MMRNLLRLKYLFPSLVVVFAIFAVALRESPAVWFAILLGIAAAIPVIVMLYSRHSETADRSAADKTKPE